MKRLIFLVLFVVLFCTPAFAQSACTYIAPGAVLTAGQWNACFEQKLNVNGSAPGAGGINTQLQYNQNGALSGVGSATYSGDVLTLASPVLITPNLGTPSALTLTNANGLPISTGVSGLGSGVAAALANTAGGSGGVALVSQLPLIMLTNADSSTILPGQLVYVSGNGTVMLARGSGLSTAGVLGAAQVNIFTSSSGTIISSGPLTLTTAQWDAVVTGESGGLASGSLYFLDPSTKWNLTTTAPSTPGQVVVSVGRAVSTTTLVINIGSAIAL